MLHLGRETPQGMELINRYWIGTHPSWQRFDKFPGTGKSAARAMPASSTALEELAYEMAVHDMTEFTTLGRFLPALWRKFA